MAAVETIRFKDLCIDAGDPEVLAAFWAPALGLRAESSGGDFGWSTMLPSTRFG